MLNLLNRIVGCIQWSVRVLFVVFNRLYIIVG
jgi:hypothetical protein